VEKELSLFAYYKYIFIHTSITVVVVDKKESCIIASWE
jgi:hypothetical protein